MGRTELKALLAKYKIQPTRKFGQNFCCDDQLAEALARDANIQTNELILEVGTGTGALTRKLAELGNKVLSFEVDKALFELSSNELVAYKNLEVIHTDVLATENQLHEIFLNKIHRELASGEYAGLRLVANLPYNIATALVIQVFEQNWPLQGMFILVQREAAERFLANPGQKIYGAVSILIQSHCYGRIVRIVPRDVFYPKPKVLSAFLELKSRPEEEKLDSASYEIFRALVRGLFSHRRKTLNKAAKLAVKEAPQLTLIHEVLEELAVETRARIEDLEPSIFEEVARKISELNAKQT